MVRGRSRRRPISNGEAVVRTLDAEHGGAVLAYVTRVTGDRAAAEDVLQETLLRAWRKPDLLESGKGSGEER
jgi:RNA polymerase sigma-70 factor (ECF subfamily)